MNGPSSHTVGRALHWIATIYTVTCIAIFICLIGGGLLWLVVKICKAIGDGWPLWVGLVAFITISAWAFGKIDREGMAWQKSEAPSDSQETLQK